MDVYQAQAKTFKYWRQMKQLSQYAVSKQTCICLQSVWQYEHGRSIPLHKVLIFCDCFGITLLDWFATVDFFLRRKDDA